MASYSNSMSVPIILHTLLFRPSISPVRCDPVRCNSVCLSVRPSVLIRPSRFAHPGSHWVLSNRVSVIAALFFRRRKSNRLRAQAEGGRRKAEGRRRKAEGGEGGKVRKLRDKNKQKTIRETRFTRTEKKKKRKEKTEKEGREEKRKRKKIGQ